MATDIKLIVKNLLEFYDFSGKVVISVGAGGGQMIEYAGPAKHVMAVDSDESAISKLKESLKGNPLEHKFDVIHSNFYDISAKGDVVLFEMCLHEMPDQILALEKAKIIAKDIVIFDHLPGDWAHYTGESEKVENSWKAVHAFKVRREKHYDGIQHFKDYKEVYEKLKVQGEPTLTRIKDFTDSKEFKIQMPYALALI